MKHFIFGYGSLICPQSRAITAPSLEDAIAEPVVIRNIERTWSARVTGTGNKYSNDPSVAVAAKDRDHIHGWTPMGVRFRSGAKCNGVLICVDEEELMRFDVREAGYDRQRIDLADIHRHLDSDTLINESMSLWPTSSVEVGDEETSARSSLREKLALEEAKCSECRLVFEKACAKRRKSGSASSECDSSQECDDMAVWVYVQSHNLPAERSFPITQSYVDIIMRGCLSISQDFARRFLETTHGWWHDGPLDRKGRKINTPQTMEDTGADCDIKMEQNSIKKHHTWINDRLNPMYVRADNEFSLQNGEAIDELIKEHHPHALQRRVISM
eukprot:CAMPEP_0181122526 /NCGR_PEP_ID=MMETSP1071-20121207/25364_1 /TAXON_ID=35127 /ORGANISM="Thalassiosira sp., Strain NH16" /LENGTH=328 /DNA_ID=CAMNT_0023207509 /DNA_START=313 /DNA_END=1299 /DNA_ORIENTATION=-